MISLTSTLSYRKKKQVIEKKGRVRAPRAPP